MTDAAPNRPTFKHPDEETAFKLMERLWCHYALMHTLNSELWSAFASGMCDRVNRGKLLIGAAYKEVHERH